MCHLIIWAASSKFGTYRLCEQRRFRRACAAAQSRQNLRCSLIQAVSQEEPSDRKPDPWPLWMAGHAQLKFVRTECSKTQIRLTGLISYLNKECHHSFISYEMTLFIKFVAHFSYLNYMYIQDILKHVMSKPFNAMWEQRRRRSACASAQSDQWLWCLLTRYYDTCIIIIISILEPCFPLLRVGLFLEGVLSTQNDFEGQQNPYLASFCHSQARHPMISLACQIYSVQPHSACVLLQSSLCCAL